MSNETRSAILFTVWMAANAAFALCAFTMGRWFQVDIGADRAITSSWTIIGLSLGGMLCSVLALAAGAYAVETETKKGN